MSQSKVIGRDSHCQIHCITFEYSTIYSKEQSNSKTPLNILLHIGRGVVFYFKKDYSRMTLNWLEYRLPSLNTIPRHLIVTKCTVKSSTGSANATFKVQNQESLRFHTKQNKRRPPHAYQRYSTLVIYCTQRNQLVAGVCICTLTHAAEPVNATVCDSHQLEPAYEYQTVTK